MWSTAWVPSPCSSRWARPPEPARAPAGSPQRRPGRSAWPRRGPGHQQRCPGGSGALAPEQDGVVRGAGTARGGGRSCGWKVMAVAVREQSRARVIYSLPEQRRPGSPGGFGLFGLLALALALFAGGLLIGRWTGTAPEKTPAAQRGASTPQAPAATSGASTAQSAPTAALPASRPLTVNGEQVWSGRTVNGVPVGWDHSEAGAVGAATNYTAALASSELMFDAARRSAAVDTVAAPFFGIDDAHKALAQIVAGKVIFQTIPVRYRLDAYDGAHARVSIWQT